MDCLVCFMIGLAAFVIALAVASVVTYVAMIAMITVINAIDRQLEVLATFEK